MPELREDLRDWFKEKWVRFDTKGNIKGECARGKGEGKPKCLPLAKAQALGKEKRAKAARRKRAKDPVADRKGKGESPVWVKTEEFLYEENKPNDSKLWARAVAAAKRKFDVYPCVPMDSQAITKDGPKSYEDLSVGDEILSYNIEKDILEWSPIRYLHFYENAPLKKISKATGFSIRATDNHKWVVRTGDKYEKVSLVETKDLHKRMRLVTCASLENYDNQILESWSKKDDWTSKILSLSKNMREVYLASSIIYDGHDSGESTKIKDRHTFGFSQKNDDHFWAAILAAYLNGYHVTFHEKSETITSASIIRNKKFHSTQNLIIEDDVSEDVWCPTTDNQTWVMIQNGFITITGNSAYANAWAANWYRKKGGTWRVVKEENLWNKIRPVIAEAKTPAWQRKEGQRESGGLNQKGVEAYRRENPGSKLKTAVTTKPSKLKKGSKAWKRRRSFCKRMTGMKKKLTSAKTARDPNARINKSLRAWNC